MKRSKNHHHYIRGSHTAVAVTTRDRFGPGQTPNQFRVGISGNQKHV